MKNNRKLKMENSGNNGKWKMENGNFAARDIRFMFLFLRIPSLEFTTDKLNLYKTNFSKRKSGENLF